MKNLRSFIEQSGRSSARGIRVEGPASQAMRRLKERLQKMARIVEYAERLSVAVESIQFPQVLEAFCGSSSSSTGKQGVYQSVNRVAPPSTEKAPRKAYKRVYEEVDE